MEMEVGAVDAEALEPRDYQQILAEQAKQSNKILYLPTGSGKTYIAIMVLKDILQLLKKPYHADGKRAIFLVNTVALVSQQAKVLKRHIDVQEVGQYSGDMNIDNWTKEIWEEQFIAYEVMVMTAEILNQLLLKNFIDFPKLALLIFDECHHAVEDHPMRQIMRQMEKCPSNQQPKVLGLSATLLNSTPRSREKVIESVKLLEITLHSTVATVDSWELVKKFSTKPRETLEIFPSNPILNSSYLETVDKLVTFCEGFQFDFEKPSESNKLKEGFRPLPSSKKNFLKNLMVQVSKQNNSLGPYGASKTALAVATTLHTILLKTEDRRTQLGLAYLLTSLSLIRKQLDIVMKEYPNECDRAIHFTTKKFKLLLKLLKDHHRSYEQNTHGQEDTIRVLVFVQERMTAKILSSVLKNCGRHPEFSFLHPSFMVGQTFDPINESWEAAIVKKRNMDVVEKFRDGTSNTLVCSDVLEEGIDIPLCNMVIKFDKVLSYRSYIQCKGRARNKRSRFIIMTEHSEEQSVSKSLEFYKEIEQILIKLLVGQTDHRDSPTEEELYAHLYGSKIPPYETPNRARVTLTSAISLLNGYTMTLARDRFSNFVPTYGSKTGGGGVIVYVQLPKTSSFQEQVEGQVMPTVKFAKRAAALQMCIKLHKSGELDDNLLPNKVRLTAEDTADLFPLWLNEPSIKLPGTKGVTRQYNQNKPICLSGFSDLKRPFFLYMIKMTPSSASADKTTLFIHSLLTGCKRFAILSCNKIPEVGCFPVYFKFGIVEISIQYVSEITLTDQEVFLVQKFHCTLFTSIIPIAKSYMYLKEVKDNVHYFVTPLIEDNMNPLLDWTTISSTVEKSEEIQSPWTALGSVVKPNHRVFNHMEVFIVCSVSASLTALSPFPNPEFKNYCDYFKRKYNFEIAMPTLPLLEVVPFMLHSDCLNPRVGQKTSGVAGQHYTIHFPSEMCHMMAVDASLLVQATLLPSCLHRWERLLIANDLRVRISAQAGIGSEAIPKDVLKTLQPADLRPPTETETPRSVTWKETVQTQKCKMLKLDPCSPWGFDEPVDIERDFETLTYENIVEYSKFTSMKMHVSKSPYRARNKQVVQNRKEHSLPCFSEIKCLKWMDDAVGPHPCDIYEALTASSADDIVNYERFETLGDSFLKFAVSLFLFMRFPNMSEGHCTEIKGKLLGNRNLFYCAQKKNLGNYLKVHKKAVWETFTPPFFTFPSEILERIDSLPGVSNYVRKIVLSNDEKLHGFVLPESLNFINPFKESENPVKLEWPEMQTINDKCVADSVEALIGCYLQTCGPRNALILLEWFKVLPPYVIYGNILTRDMLSSHITSRKSCFGLFNEKGALEYALCYNFKDPGLLLEAITHSSFPGHQNSYERLEFIGDALLDFLITAYIYEHCGSLTPGELTDLRSALVNNITFACLTVRNGFHKFLKNSSASLFYCIDRFVVFQEGRNHRIDDEVLILLEEDECKLAETVLVPKALGDIFEALAGAIFLDSNKSLTTVWKVFYNLMKNEISLFSNAVPKQVVRRLHEAVPHGVKFRASEDKSLSSFNQTMVELAVTLGTETRYYNGFGWNKSQAKKSAAKLALRDLKL